MKLDDLIKEILLRQEAESLNLSQEEKDTFFSKYMNDIKEQNGLTDERPPGNFTGKWI